MTARIGTITLFLLWAVAALAQGTGVIRKIDVQGNKEVSTQAILAAMRTKPGQAYLQANLDADQKALEDLGYFQSVDVRAKAAEGDTWDVIVQVLEWPVVKELRIIGNTVVPTAELQKLISVQPGKIFNLRDAVASSKRIEEAYSKKGFFGGVEEFAPLRESPNTVNVSIREMMINSVSVQGNSHTKTKVLKKLIKSRAGQAYNRNRWELDLRRIYGTQWFENVKSSEDQPDPFKVNLVADVKETRTGQFNVGVQIDPRSSFAGVVKLSDSNFRGTGQAVGIDILQGTKGSGASLTLDYANPFIDNHSTTLTTSVYSRVLYRFAGNIFGGNSTPTNNNFYTERRTGGAIGLSRPVNDYSAVGISTRFEQIITSNLNTTNQAGFIQQDGTVMVGTLGYTTNHRDVDIDPSRGHWFRVQLEPGFSDINRIGGSAPDPSILGGHGFVKLNADFRKYFTRQPPRGRELDAPRRVVAFRAYAGMIRGKTPFFEQFFAGGSDTVRGYQEDRFWGNNTLLLNLEYRHPIQKAFSVIAFVDYGGAWGGYGSVNTFTQSSRIKLHLGYGVGLSFRTPLGPLRFDLGFDENGKSRTHFLIGTSF